MPNSDLSRHGYQIVRELGHNRAGGRVTYLAAKIATRQPVVIKQFQFATNASWTDYDAYQQEIQVLQGLNHPGIPHYLDSFPTKDGFCMVQEYKKAPSLVVPRSFSAEEIKQIAVSLLEILVYLQERFPAVIHRDIKPENILVDKNINVFLVDFGLARIGEGELTVSSVAKGTLGFMAPEQLFNRQLSAASDLYGVGATLICLITGTKSIEISELVDDDYRINFKYLVPKLSLHWLDWLGKMVELKPKDRFPNAAAALLALKPIFVIRVPEVKLSQTHLDLSANRLGERLTSSVTVINSIPDTLLEGDWYVNRHESDPPHSLAAHPWISFSHPKFSTNLYECKITVDTGKLRADTIYERELIIQSNSLPQTHSVKLKVKTAPIPIKSQTLPYKSLVSLVLLATAAAWVEVNSWIGTINQSGDVGMAIALFVTAFIGVFGMTTAIASGSLARLVAKIRAKYHVKIKAIDTAVVMLVTALVGLLVTRFGANFRTSEATTAVDIVAFMAIFGASKVTKNCLNRGWSQIASFIALLCVGLGITLGMGMKLGFLNLPVMSALLGISSSLAAVILYPPLERARLIRNYRRSQQYLIQP